MSRRSKKRERTPRPSGDAARQPPQPQPALPSRLHTLLICIGLVLLVAVPYAQVARHEFTVCDDKDYIYENSTVCQGLTWEGFRWAFEAPHAGNWHPLTWVSHMIDCSCFGQASGWHHLVSVAIHAASAVVLFLAFRMMTGALWSSAIVAALFAVHPLRVESVAWAAERKDVLSGLFWMFSLLGYAWYVRRPGAFRYTLVFVAFGLGLMAKSMLVTLPCVLLLLDVWPLRRWPCPPRAARWLLLEKIPLVALAIADSVMAVHGQRLGESLNSLDAMPMSTRILNALVSYVAYLWQTIWPVNLSIFYPHPGILNKSLSPTFMAMAFGAGLLLMTLTVLVVSMWRRRPYLAVGWFWYLGTLLPVIGLVQVGAQGRADRYTYLPSVGLYIMVVWAARQWALRQPRVQPFLAITSAAAIAACVVLSWFQVGYWKNSFTLFEHAADVTRDNYFAHNHLGIAYHDQNHIEEAAAEFEKVVAIHPSDDHGNNNLGECYLRLKQFAKGEFYLLRAIAMHPGYADAHNNLSCLYCQTGRMDDALAHSKLALESHPDSAAFLMNEGYAYERKGDLAHATADYERAIQCDRRKVDAHFLLGLLADRQGHTAEAIERFKQVIAIDPANADAYNALGALYAKTGDYASAELHISKAVRLNPKHDGARHNLEIVRESRKASGQ